MELELHERVLVFLFEKRNTSEQYDLRIEFKETDRTTLDEAAEYLKERKFITLEYPVYGIGWVSDHEIKMPELLSADHLLAKILPAGIDQVKNHIMKQKGKRLSIKGSIINIDSKSGNQSLNSSKNKTVTNAPTTETSMIKKIVIGVIIAVGSALILFYFFGING